MKGERLLALHHNFGFLSLITITYFMVIYNNIIKGVDFHYA